MAMLYRETVAQAQLLAYADDFWLLAVMFAIVPFFLPLMRRIRLPTAPATGSGPERTSGAPGGGRRDLADDDALAPGLGVRHDLHRLETGRCPPLPPARLVGRRARTRPRDLAQLTGDRMQDRSGQPAAAHRKSQRPQPVAMVGPDLATLRCEQGPGEKRVVRVQTLLQHAVYSSGARKTGPYCVRIFRCPST